MRIKNLLRQIGEAIFDRCLRTVDDPNRALTRLERDILYLCQHGDLTGPRLRLQLEADRWFGQPSYAVLYRAVERLEKLGHLATRLSPRPENIGRAANRPLFVIVTTSQGYRAWLASAPKGVVA